MWLQTQTCCLPTPGEGPEAKERLPDRVPMQSQGGTPTCHNSWGRSCLSIVSFRNLSRLYGGNAHPLSAIQLPLPSCLLPQTLLPLQGPRTETERTARTTLWAAALSLTLLLTTGPEVLGRKEGRGKQEKAICLWVRAKDHRTKEANPREKP